MSGVTDSIVVNAEPDAIWDVIAGFEQYPEWQDGVKEAEVLETGDDGWATRVRFVIDAQRFRAEMVIAYTYTDDEMRWQLVEGDGVKENTGSYRLEPLDNGSTRVTYELEVTPSIRLPGVLRRMAAQRIVDTALRGMKQRVEDGA